MAAKFRPHVNTRIVSFAASIARDHPRDPKTAAIGENVAKHALQFVASATLLRDACQMACDIQADDASGAHQQRVKTVFTHMSSVLEEAFTADLQEHIEVLVLLGAALSDDLEAKQHLSEWSKGLGLSTQPMTANDDPSLMAPADQREPAGTRRKKSRD